MNMRRGLGKGTGKIGYYNLAPMDSHIHSLAAKGVKSYSPIPQMRTLNASSYDKEFYDNYIIDAISTEGYDVEAKTTKEKLQFLKRTFESEYGHMIPRVGEQKAFSEWIRSLPSTFNIEFYNNEIIELAKKGKSLPENPTEKQEDKILENYWDFIAARTFHLFKKYKVDEPDQLVKKHQAWKVYSGGKHIDTVFYQPNLDREYVKEGLINHDNYPSDIRLVKER
jgi:hypothetical protein